VGLANLGSESETCVGSHVHLVGVSISFEKNFYRLPFTPPLSGSPYRSFSASLLGPPVGSASLPAVHSCRGRRTHLETSPTTLWSQVGAHVAHKRGCCPCIPRQATPPRLCSAVPATRDCHGEVRCRSAAKPAEAFFTSSCT
jgi:hypothetical protein